jgi:hypothetical protein
MPGCQLNAIPKKEKIVTHSKQYGRRKKNKAYSINKIFFFVNQFSAIFFQRI